MDEKALRIERDDQANRLADVRSALLFLQKATEFSETSDEVAEGFLETARTMLPKLTGDLGAIIGDLRTEGETGDKEA